MRVRSLLLALVFPTMSLLAQSVGVDPTFNAADPGFNYGGAFNNAVSEVIELPDGKLLVCGWFTEYNGVPCSRIARLLPDGGIDPTFDVGVGPDNTVRDMVVQPDGKILVSGYFFNINGLPRWGLARFNNDGTLDEGFDQGTTPSLVFYGQPESLGLQADGKVLLGGYHFCGDGVVQNCIKRFNTDGSLDASFNTGGAGICVNNQAVTSIFIRPDSKILIAGTFNSYNGQPVNNMALLNSNGTLDNTFPAAVFNGTAAILSFFPDGDMLMAGGFTTVNGIAKPHVAKVSTNGVLDPSFHAEFKNNGVVTANIYCATVRTDGRVILGGLFDECNGVEHEGVVRLLPDGTVDPAFNTAYTISGQITEITELSDGRLMLGGNYSGFELSYMFGLSRAHPEGALDRTFNPGWGVNNEVRALAVQPDGKTIISGQFSRVNTTWTPGIARVNTDGTFDPTFDAGTGLFRNATDIKVRPDGRILVSGMYLYDGQEVGDVIQLEPDGTIDPSFDPQCGTSSGVSDMAILADGRTLVCGNFATIDGIARRAVARLNEDGSVDESFDVGVGPVGALLESMAVMADGRIVVAGTCTLWSGQAVGRIMRLLPNGAPDPSFNTGTGFNSYVHNVLAMPDGRVVASGPFTSFNGVARNGIARLNVDGSLDTTFDPGTGLDGNWSTLLLDFEGNVIVGGLFETVNGQPLSHIVRLTTSGAVDPDFTIGSGFGRNGYATIPTVNEMALLPNGQLMVGGSFTSFNGVGRNRLLRLFAPTTVGVSEVTSNTTMTAWPNPTDGRSLNVSIPDLGSTGAIHFSVVDASGRMVWQQRASANGPWELRFDHDLAAGTYQLVVLASGSVTRTAFQVQR